MKPSMLPFILLAELIVIWLATRRARRLKRIEPAGELLIATQLFLLGVFAGLSSLLAISGAYRSEVFLGSWPAFWLTMITPSVIMLPVMVSAKARDVVRGIIDATPLHWLVAFQGLRILAIGGIVKAANGEFSAYYATYIAVPDMLFGTSAFVVAWLVASERLRPPGVAIWNLVGAMIIVPFGMVLLQMGLPGPWQVFKAAPTIATIFEFPMALAPSVVVPIFVMANLLVALRLIERHLSAARFDRGAATR
jgi:hypothetical protein